jgi:hypothetical protein
MGGSKERKRQKKLERHRKDRQAAQRRVREQTAALVPTGARLIELASRGALGPAWVSNDYENLDAPALVTAAITRRAPGGLLLGQIVLVDRTCLGIKNAYTTPSGSEIDFRSRIEELGDRGLVLEPCDPLIVQSVVFHAIDYARALGFEPHRDFIGAFFTPRPEKLVETPWAHAERPWYIPGPSDDTTRIMRALAAKVGALGFEVAPDAWDDDLDDDDLDDDDLDDATAYLPRRLAGGDEWRAERIDWREALRGVPVDDVLDGIDLGTAEHLREAIEGISLDLENGRSLAWEAVLREEQQSLLSDAHVRKLDDLVSFSEDPDDERTLYIDEIARPPEPWYATVRRLLPHLIFDRYATWEHLGGVASLGDARARSIEEHGRELSSPGGLTNPLDVIDPLTRHRLRVQATFGVLAGVGAVLDGDTVTLTDPQERWRIEEFATALGACHDAMQALGWTLDDLLRVPIGKACVAFWKGSGRRERPDTASSRERAPRPGADLGYRPCVRRASSMHSAASFSISIRSLQRPA